MIINHKNRRKGIIAWYNQELGFGCILDLSDCVTEHYINTKNIMTIDKSLDQGDSVFFYISQGEVKNITLNFS